MEKVLAEFFETGASERGVKNQCPRKESLSRLKFGLPKKGCAWHAHKRYGGQELDDMSFLCSCLNSWTKKLTRRLSKSPLRWVSPAVALTSKMPSSKGRHR